MSITTPEVAITLANERDEMEAIGRKLDAAAKSAISVEELRSAIHEMGGVIIGKIYRDPDSGWSGTAEVEGHRLSFPAF
jgi:hypothetical protein